MPLTIISKPPRPFNLPFLDFLGGLNTSDRDEYIDDNELSDVANYLPEEPGSPMLRKRLGITNESTTFSSVDGQLVYDGKHANYFCVSDEIKLFDGTTVTGSLTSSTTWDAATMLDMDIFVNGTDERKSTNGTSTSALGGSPPSFKYIEVHNNFLFGAGHSLGLLRWADLGTTETWSATNGLTLSTDEDDNITGLAKFRDVLMVFSDKRFFRINGTTTVDMEITYTAHEGPGCTSNRSIVVTNAGVFWWSDKGLVASDDGLTTDLPMQRKLRRTLDGLNASKFADIHCVWDEKHDRIQCYVYNGSSTTVDLCIYYYYLSDSFFLGTGNGIKMNTSGVALKSGDPTVYTAGYGADQNRLFEVIGDRDVSTNISAFLESKRFWPGATPTALSRIRDYTLKTGPVPTNGNITVGAYLDDETSINSTNSFTVAATTTVADYPIFFPRRINKMKIRIADALATRPRIAGAVIRGHILND